MAADYDEKFEELTNLALKMAGGIDELRMEMRDWCVEGRGLRVGLDEVRTELKSLGGAVQGLKGQLTKNTIRLTSVEEKLSLLSDQFNDVAGWQ